MHRVLSPPTRAELPSMYQNNTNTNWSALLTRYLHPVLRYQRWLHHSLKSWRELPMSPSLQLLSRLHMKLVPLKRFPEALNNLMDSSPRHHYSVHYFPQQQRTRYPPSLHELSRNVARSYIHPPPHELLSATILKPCRTLRSRK
jgi:hypothetical protein